MTFTEFLKTLSPEEIANYQSEYKRVVESLTRQMKAARRTNAQITTIRTKMLGKFQNNAMSGMPPLDAATDAILFVGYIG